MSIPIRVLAVPTVFKTVLRAVAINAPYGGVRRIRTFETFRFAALAVRCNRPDSAITPYVMQDCRTCGKLPLARSEVIAHALFFRFLTKKRHSLSQRWRLTSFLFCGIFTFSLADATRAGTGEEIRTPNPLRALDFKSRMHTSSITPAYHFLFLPR